MTCAAPVPFAGSRKRLCAPRRFLRNPSSTVYRHVKAQSDREQQLREQEDWQWQASRRAKALITLWSNPATRHRAPSLLDSHFLVLNASRIRQQRSASEELPFPAACPTASTAKTTIYRPSTKSIPFPDQSEHPRPFTRRAPSIRCANGTSNPAYAGKILSVCHKHSSSRLVFTFHLRSTASLFLIRQLRERRCCHHDWRKRTKYIYKNRLPSPTSSARKVRLRCIIAGEAGAGILCLDSAPIDQPLLIRER